MTVMPELPEPRETIEDETRLAEVFIMPQEERLALMGPGSASILRLAAIAAKQVAETSGNSARDAFFAGVAIGSVAQKFLERASEEHMPSFEDELAAIEQAI